MKLEKKSLSFSKNIFKYWKKNIDDEWIWSAILIETFPIRSQMTKFVSA